MKRQQRGESIAARGQQSQRTPYRLYTASQIISLLQISRSGFYALKRRGQLPFLHALHFGRAVRFRADLVDRHLAGKRT